MMIIDEKAQVIESLREQGLEFCDFFEHLKVESLQRFNKSPLERRPQVVLLNFSSLLAHPREVEDFKIQLGTYAGVVIICHSAEERISALKFAQEVPKVLGIYGPNLNKEEGTLLGNLLSYFWSTSEEQRKLQQRMFQFSVEIEKMMEGAQEDMLRARALHEKFLPKRTETVKGLNFYSKFMTGTGRGVEYFDLITTSQKSYQIHLTTDSYLVSGTLLALLERHKTNSFDPKVFLKEAYSDIAVIQKEKAKEVSVELIIVEIDLNELLMTTHGKSSLKILRSGKEIELLDNLQLSKGEKLIILSAGYVKNLKQISPPFNLEKVYSQNSDLSPHELLSEMIFKIKSEQQSDQEMSDMVAVMVEVNRHGMHQV